MIQISDMQWGGGVVMYVCVFGEGVEGVFILIFHIMYSTLITESF